MRLAQRLRKAGGSARYIAYDDLGQVGILLALADSYIARAPVLDDITMFLNADSVSSEDESLPRREPLAQRQSTQPREDCSYRQDKL